MAQALTIAENLHSLRVDFSWRKFGYLIQDARTDEHLMSVKHNSFKPHLEFIDAKDKSTTATATVHYFSIHADCTVGSRDLRLKAQKRFRTEYAYLSYAYSDSETPVVMTWTASTSLSKWDFVLLDENLEAVARYSTNIWALQKIGSIEFVGPKAESKAARDEVVVTVCTIYYCMTGMYLEDNPWIHVR